MASENMVVAALGRPFTLGMLYDARTDKLIPGFTLWDEETLQNNTTESCQHSSAFQITSSDSIEEKTNLLDVEASLKASFFGGLVEVGGSAKYLNDQKKFKNQSRVTLQYEATTNFSQLMMTPEARKSQHVDDVVRSLATHVVTGIIYGANAFFVFDSEKLDAGSVQKIQGGMEAVIRKIPSLDIQGKIDLMLSDSEKALTEKFSCVFHGDFIVDNNPATFKDAVKTYQELPKLLGEHKENGVPLKVWLMPLKDLESTAAEVVKQVSVTVLREVEEALEDLNQLEMRCNESLEDSSIKCFPRIQKKLRSFQRNCNDYRSSLQEDIAKKLLSIRVGEEDESSIKKLLEDRDRDKSPFSDENLNNWLLDKEKEIDTIKSCLDVMEGTDIITSESDFNRVVFSSGVEDVLCFVFTSLQSADAYLDKMDDYLQLHGSQATVDVSPSKDQWYTSDEVRTRMREKAKTFHNLSKELKSSRRVRFLITAESDKKNKGASIYHYNNGKLITSDFSKPDVPPPEEITDKTEFMWYGCDLTLDPNTVNYNLNITDGNKKVTHGAKQSYPGHPERFLDCPQVLCKQGLTGRHYWEVEWGDGYEEEVSLGVAYKGITRKKCGSRFGKSNMSWCFGFCGRTNQFFSGHDGKRNHHRIPDMGCKQVGVYLDWPAGTFSFYQVSSNTLTHIHTFKAKFTEPVYPGCYITRKTDWWELIKHL